MLGWLGSGFVISFGDLQMPIFIGLFTWAGQFRWRWILQSPAGVIGLAASSLGTGAVGVGLKVWDLSFHKVDFDSASPSVLCCYWCPWVQGFSGLTFPEDKCVCCSPNRDGLWAVGCGTKMAIWRLICYRLSIHLPVLNSVLTSSSIVTLVPQFLSLSGILRLTRASHLLASSAYC